MKVFAIQVRTATATHVWTQLASTGTEAFMAAYDRFAGVPARISFREQRA